MQIWLTRHGQTNLNRKHLMQGRTDEPLNENGLAQAHAMREILEAAHPSLRFDAVYASPLQRAVVTASILGGVPQSQILIDERLIEVDFGKYEKRSFFLLGPRMSAYWSLPEVFPVPETVETIPSMTARAQSFLKELETKDYQHVLVTCHGGILRALCGYMQDRPNGVLWRPKPHNCEVRVYDSRRSPDGAVQHALVENYKL